jgi:hypothetical protein
MVLLFVPGLVQHGNAGMAASRVNAVKPVEVLIASVNLMQPLAEGGG